MNQPRFMKDAPLDGTPVLLWLGRWQTAKWGDYTGWVDTEHKVELPDEPLYWCELPPPPHRVFAEQERNRLAVAKHREARS